MRKGHKRFDTYRSLVDVWCSSLKVGTFCRFGEGQNSEEFRYAHIPFESPLCKHFFLFSPCGFLECLGFRYDISVSILIGRSPDFLSELEKRIS